MTAKVKEKIMTISISDFDQLTGNIEKLEEELRDLEDKNIVELDDLTAAARVLARATTETATRLSEANDRLYEVLRGLKVLRTSIQLNEK